MQTITELNEYCVLRNKHIIVHSGKMVGLGAGIYE